MILCQSFGYDVYKCEERDTQRQRKTQKTQKRPRNVAERRQVLTLGGQLKDDHYPTVSAFVSA